MLSSLKPKVFIHLKRFLIIDPRKRLHTDGSLDIAERDATPAIQKSLDPTRLSFSVL